ncbi:MAG: hypothetical protein RMK50_07060 [Nitrososphaerota archaeon]|nr:hypothetical protein [Candidatus Bathyarchaeota archaeon]MDW8194557.1 hypothetical protein [Nitrososphaerota archaeon]
MAWIKEALSMLRSWVQEQVEETVGKKLTDEEFEGLVELFVFYHHMLRVLKDKLLED